MGKALRGGNSYGLRLQFARTPHQFEACWVLVEADAAGRRRTSEVPARQERKRVPLKPGVASPLTVEVSQDRLRFRYGKETVMEHELPFEFVSVPGHVYVSSHRVSATWHGMVVRTARGLD
jgi:hypothetical protein